MLSDLSMTNECAQRLAMAILTAVSWNSEVAFWVPGC